MERHHIDHIAIRVESLGQAQNFYTHLFNMQREDDAGDGSDHRTLRRGDLRLGLHQAVEEVATNSRCAHVGIHVPPEELSALLATAEALGCTVGDHTEVSIAFEDPYGLCWEVTGRHDE